MNQWASFFSYSGKNGCRALLAGSCAKKELSQTFPDIRSCIVGVFRRPCLVWERRKKVSTCLPIQSYNLQERDKVARLFLSLKFLYLRAERNCIPKLFKWRVVKGCLSKCFFANFKIWAGRKKIKLAFTLHTPSWGFFRMCFKKQCQVIATKNEDIATGCRPGPVFFLRHL